MFIGAGTAINVAAVLAGSSIGAVLGHRLPPRTRIVVTDALGLVTLLIAGLSAMSVTDRALTGAVGDDAPVLIVLGAVLLGGIAGSLLRIEDRIEGFGGWLQGRLAGSGTTGHRTTGHRTTGHRTAGHRTTDHREDRARFVEGFVTASLIFCVGPLTILGSINEGLGLGAQELVLKSVLDGFAAVAFAASFGIGVMASALSLIIVQGTLTALGALLGSFVPEPHLLALTATGGVLLAGVGLRLLHIRQVAVGDLLPALVIAPLITQLVIAVS